VWSITTYDNSERDDEIIYLGLEKLRCEARYLESTWYPISIDILESVRLEEFSVHFLEWGCMVNIELSDYKSDTNIRVE
jgi:hypothetical protein